jgi:hypothetical protein
MKRRFLVIGMGLILMLSLASAAGAVLGLTSAGEACRNNNNFFLGTFDTCVVCVNKGNNAHTCLCKFLNDQGFLPALGFANFGACVSTFAMMP